MYFSLFSCRDANAKRVYLVVIDGGADWSASELMVQQEFPWISFLHCVAHQGSLIVKDICKIAVIDELLQWMTDAQKWFGTNKLGPLLKIFCRKHYGTTRAFIFPAETRFAGKLLQIKRFLSMKSALQQCVLSAQYLRFDFADDIFAPRICRPDVWNLMENIVTAAGPVLLLLRLADSNAATLSKLKGTVDYIKNIMPDKGTDTLADKIAIAFHNRAPELESGIADAAWIIDPQFVDKSRKSSSELMGRFWDKARALLRISDDTAWQTKRALLVTELASFRMKTGGFAIENYVTQDSCSFWSVVGYHAPNLRELSMKLAPLPCSSGEAERNWFEVRQSLTKKRNQLGRETLAKMVFVRRFVRLKQKLCANDINVCFSDWVTDLLSQAAENGETTSSTCSSGASAASADADVFNDSIEPGEYGRINGREPGQLPISLTALKKDHACKSWLFNKYYNMCLLDKNPEGDSEATALEDESAWEHRVIKQIVWRRREGYATETCLYGNADDQSIVQYLINDSLHSMIRDSPHNSCRMLSQTESAVFESSDSDE